MARIPVGVEDNHNIGTRQVEAHTTRSTQKK